MGRDGRGEGRTGGRNREYLPKMGLEREGREERARDSEYLIWAY